MPSSTQPQPKDGATTLTAFRASLDDKDRLIHDLAVRMLKTRYTPERTNAYAAFVASAAKGAK